MKILIVTDAWYPQVNGVCRTLKNLGDELKKIVRSYIKKSIGLKPLTYVEIVRI